MTKYIKTGTTEFKQFNETEWNKIYHDCSDPDEWEAKASKLGVDRYHGYFIIPTKEGDMRIHDGDWIATGVNGEHWPVKDEIFKKTYKMSPVIPKYVADYIELQKDYNVDLFGVIASSKKLGSFHKSDDVKARIWVSNNCEDFSRAWLDGYEVL